MSITIKQKQSDQSPPPPDMTGDSSSYYRDIVRCLLLAIQDLAQYDLLQPVSYFLLEEE